ncbi:MAG TPA: dTDP-4-dehydrorhamnose 3,5-epimerase [Acidimicrobiales bacterium]|nr:dTDP-4-dehydrorhamnose 3,5-epimerase [Acidimicrobiales bacterium]
MPEVKESPEMAGVVVVMPDVHGDARGRFVESFRQEWLPAGAPAMVQGNRVDRRPGALVGLHFHLHQADYWYVVQGRARTVLHDLRRGSPTEGRTLVVDMDGEAGPGLYIPPGVAHGFAAHSDLVLTYLVDGYYNPDDELGVAWDDPDVAADWGVADPVLSGRDQANPRRRDLPEAVTPTFGPRVRL